MQMLYVYIAEYTTKHSATCSDEDLNNTEKIWLSFNTSSVYQIWIAKRLWRWTLNPGVVSSSPAVERRIFHFVNLASAPCSWRKPMQMKSTMTYT